MSQYRAIVVRIECGTGTETDTMNGRGESRAHIQLNEPVTAWLLQTPKMNTGGKTTSLTNNTGKTEYPHIEGWNLILLAHPANRLIPNESNIPKKTWNSEISS